MIVLLKRGLGTIFIATLVLFLYFGVHPSVYPKTEYANFETFPSNNITKATKVILFWNGFFSYTNWNLLSSPRKLQCGKDECIYTSNHKFLSSLEKFDALLFHAAVSFEPPPRRDSKQHYVFALLEAPPNTHHKLTQEENFYNLTMTYRLDSDVLWPYSYVFETDTRQRVAPARYPPWKNSSFFQTFVPSKGLRQQLESKRKSVAWFVSNCKTFSKREKLVKELQKYIQIDIFGDCGTYSCPSERAHDCNYMLDNDYKFYLSFENSLCIDYVTEKLFNALNRRIVPIVFGGANYNSFAPPNSYINAEDFDTVEELGNYLLTLTKNIDEYAKYFWWKDLYMVKQYDKDDFPETYCELCNLLHSKSVAHRTQFYRNIEDYWLRACKIEPNIKFS